MVPFKGRTRIKQHNPNKPKKWGYTFYVSCDDEGLVYDFKVHTGKMGVCPNQPDIGASGNIVLALLENVEQHKRRNLFVCNWYTGTAFATTLIKGGVSLSGIIRNNIIANCNMPKYNNLKKNDRSSYEKKKQLLMMLYSLQLSGLIIDP